MALPTVRVGAQVAAVDALRGDKTVDTRTPEATTDALDQYGRDLTKLARAGKLDPVIGRDDEIKRTIQILSRRTKNNACLVGEPFLEEITSKLKAKS